MTFSRLKLHGIDTFLCLRSGDVAVDVEWILRQITQVLQHNEKQPRAVDGRHVEFASIARILSIQLKTDYSTCCA